MKAMRWCMIVGCAIGAGACSSPSRAAAPTPLEAPALLATPMHSASVSRNWTDVSGKYHMQGALVAADAQRVRLHKNTGATIIVPLDRLSAGDRRFVATALAQVKSNGQPARSAPQTRSAPNSPKRSSSLTLLDIIRIPFAWLQRIPSQHPLAKTLVQATRVAARPAGDPAAAEIVGPIPENMIYIRVSAAYLAQLTRHEVARSRHVRDYILGTQVAGTAWISGHTEFHLERNDRAAVGVLR